MDGLKQLVGLGVRCPEPRGAGGARRPGDRPAGGCPRMGGKTADTETSDEDVL